MKKTELHEKNAEELMLEKNKLIDELKDIRFKKEVGVIENPLKLRTIRKNIAILNTILHEKQLNKLKKEIENME
jgi:large subunit ribosomal protein L29